MSEATSAEDLNHEQALNYEQAREELVAVVQKLETGAPLEESLALWERGERLAGICQQRLDGAKERVAAARRTAEDGADEPTPSAAD